MSWLPGMQSRPLNSPPTTEKTMSRLLGVIGFVGIIFVVGYVFTTYKIDIRRDQAGNLRYLMAYQ